MAGAFDNVGGRLGGVFISMNTSQKISLVVALLIAVGGIYGIINWASSPEYVPLFSNLPPDDAGRIADWLTENSVEYKLEQGGSRILVSREAQYSARIQLAQEGLPGKRSTGYEIFDQTNLGMSEFVQKLNFRRALEGELSRTIESIDAVDQARVHIVMPEQALFREKEKLTKASIALQLRVGLSQSQVAGIAHLVTSSVEDLEISNVTIIDSRGNVLSNLTDRDPLLAVNANQMQLKGEVEERLAEKVESMLEQLLGSDKVIVRIATDLDFTRTETLVEEFDPERVAVRSESVTESSEEVQGGSGANQVDPNLPANSNSESVTSTNNTTNYEVTKTTTSSMNQSGGIQRITASVLVDGTYETVTDADGNDVLQYQDRNQREMNMIEQAVRTAIGFDQNRGDEVSVTNFPFQTDPVEEFAEPTILTWFERNGMNLLRNLVMGIAIIGVLFYIRNLTLRSTQAARELYERRIAALPGGKAIGTLPGAIGGDMATLALPDIDSELPPEVVEANKLQQQIVDFVGERPEVAARLLKSWLIDDDD
jgi:flagellar M-ring protein FliF